MLASALRPGAALAAALAALALAIASAAALLVVDMNRQAVQDVERGLVGLSAVLADQADRSLQAMEMVQDAVIDGLREAGVATSEEYAAAAGRQDLHLALRARIAALPQVNAITIVDHAGKLLNFSRYWPIPDVNIADRDYFKALAADPGRGRFVGRPVRNRGDGAWTIYVARKVSASDGTFLGLVLGAVELGYFEGLYRQISPTDDAVVSVFRDDGMLLVRHPHRAATIGKVLPTAAAALIAARDRAGGVLRNVSPIDGHERLVATKALARYPLILSVSRTVEASLAPVRRQAFVVGASAALLVSCIAALSALFLRQARALRRAAAAEERARGERDLREHCERFGFALDNMIQGLCLFDADRRLVVMNQRFAELYAVPRHLREPGAKAEDLRRVVLSLRGEAGGDWDMVVTPPGSDAPSLTASVVRLSDDRDVSVMRVPVPGGGWICTHEDVTERRRSEERLGFLARHDALTELPNRVQFADVVARELAICAGTGQEAALLCLDLDGFKQVNDLFGHPAGDRLLVEVAKRLRGLLGERCVAARLGGDEFAVLATGLDGRRTPATTARAVIDALGAPLADGERRIDVGCSVGIASFPRDGDTCERLLSASDMALVRAKRDGKGGYRFFKPEMDAAARERHQLALDLRAAIGTPQFALHYQPQFEVATGRACGFEALLRWTHPIRGAIPPTLFVPLAEETGAILPLGEWVLREACREAATWGLPLGIAVNLSIAQFRQAELCDVVRQALAETGLRPDRLELEVTESLFLNSAARSQEVLGDLKALGVRISMDDFGTGYSSLATLQAFPFDKIKIDRSFVGQVGVTSKGGAIVRAIISLGESLGVPVIAEGIETEEQLAFLRRHRCAEMQGYLRGMPRPIAEYLPLLAAEVDLRVA
ncbi:MULTISPECIES: bifunctional diguanylate cyclase/phosphodiesterase [Methylobacterium]|jgi:diguanylate cyclase (GGDEF)-like protein|nr:MULTISPECIES: EAL domain-containing protein [Methylobacterium]MBN6819188.1 EAL domain-containing protein [Methylobacterium organophilum]OXE40560.1 GGDEF-domain containing protein [Methylobacterium radiotolerans]GAN49818.1 diguanylate cyclase/phosphodiesterase [Methylobacterium sp. ME121]